MLIKRKTLEISTAATLCVFAAAVIHGSMQLDRGWSATGPQSGYFPLRLGLLLLIVSVLLLVQSARRASEGTFATGEQLRRSLSLLLPTVVMAIAMAWLGIYLCAAVYLVFMARRHGSLSWARSLALGVVSMVMFYGIFELWFGVPLVKGPLEHWLGL